MIKLASVKQYLKAALGTALILFPLFGYVYIRGGNDGIRWYRSSKQFYYTLYSMYMFGYKDGYAKHCGEK